jgi:hypothetical protein
VSATDPIHYGFRILLREVVPDRVATVEHHRACMRQRSKKQWVRSTSGSGHFHGKRRQLAVEIIGRRGDENSTKPLGPT